MLNEKREWKTVYIETGIAALRWFADVGAPSLAKIRRHLIYFWRTAARKWPWNKTGRLR